MESNMEPKYRVLNADLKYVTGWHKTKAAAVRKCIETMNQSRIWFIEDDNRDLVSIVHCDQEWVATGGIPVTMDQLTHARVDASEYIKHVP